TSRFVFGAAIEGALRETPMGRRPVRTLWQRGMRATRVGMRPRRRLQVLPESSDPPKAGGRERDHRRPQTAEPQDPKAKAEQQDPSGRFVRGHAKLGGRRPSARGRPAKLRDREPAGQRGPSERFVPGHTKLDGRRPGSLNKGGRKPGPGRSPVRGAFIHRSRPSWTVVVSEIME